MSNLPLHVAPPVDLARWLVAEANAGDEVLQRWLGNIAKKASLPESVMAEISAAIRGIEIVTLPTFSRAHGKWSASWAQCIPAQLSEVSGYGLAMFRVIEAGLIPQIRRCALKDCQKFFVGDPRSRWCSTTCGSKYRVRAKRRRDKQ